MAYSFGCHGKVTARLIALDWVSFGGRQNQVVQVPDRADLGCSECLYGEKAADDKDGESMEVVGQKSMDV